MINFLKRYRFLFTYLTIAVIIVIVLVFSLSHKSILQNFQEATAIGITDKNVLYMTEDEGFSRHLLMHFDHTTTKETMARKQLFQNCQSTISCSQQWVATMNVSPKISFPMNDLSMEKKEVLKKLNQPPTMCQYSIRSSNKERPTLDTSNTEKQIFCLNPSSGEASYAYINTMGF